MLVQVVYETVFGWTQACCWMIARRHLVEIEKGYKQTHFDKNITFDYLRGRMCIQKVTREWVEYHRQQVICCPDIKIVPLFNEELVTVFWKITAESSVSKIISLLNTISKNQQ